MLNNPTSIFPPKAWSTAVTDQLNRLAGTDTDDQFSPRPSLDRVWFASINLSGSTYTWEKVYTYTGNIYTKQIASSTELQPDLADAEIWAANQTIYSSINLLSQPNITGSLLVPVILRDSQWECVITSPTSSLWTPVITQYVAPVAADPEAVPPVEEVIEVQPTLTFANCIYLRSPVYQQPTSPIFSLPASATGNYYCGVKISVIDGTINSTLLLNTSLSGVVYTTIAAANADIDYLRLLVCMLRYDSVTKKWIRIDKFINSVPELGMYA
jgi:hypothetical protein